MTKFGLLLPNYIFILCVSLRVIVFCLHMFCISFSYESFNIDILGYNDFDFLDKMKPPRPEIDVKCDSRTFRQK